MLRVFFLLFISISVSAQVILPKPERIPDDKEVVEKTKEPEKVVPEWRERIRYGGNVWMGFWGSFYLDATPMVGYDITGKGTIAGLGASIIVNGKSSDVGGGLSIGPRFFVRQPIWKTVFAHAEYELMNSSKYNFWDTYYLPSTGRPLRGNKWGGAGLIGLGFYQNGYGTQSGAFISVLYNVNAPSSGFISQQRIDSEGRFVFRLGFFL